MLKTETANPDRPTIWVEKKTDRLFLVVDVYKVDKYLPNQMINITELVKLIDQYVDVKNPEKEDEDV